MEFGKQEKPKTSALVLSGGGARGAFQVGAWKAMKQVGLDEQIGAVFGTSVGAINAAAFVQGDLEMVEEIWKQLSYDKVFNNDRIRSHRPYSRRFYDLARLAVKEKGLNVDPLKKILRSVIDERKIRKSDLEFGLVVFDWTLKRPFYLTKDQIPVGELAEYVIASSTFPIFQPHRINNKIYIDGGVYDNRPLAFCQSRQDIEKIFCVDVTIARYFWPNKKRRMKHKIRFIRPSRLLGSPMAFNVKRINRNIRLGYEDTVKLL